MKFYATLFAFPKEALVFTCLQYKYFENTVEKGEIDGNDQFLPFPTVFSILSENLLPFSLSYKLLSADYLNFEEYVNICYSGKG